MIVIYGTLHVCSVKEVLRNKNASAVLINLLKGEMKMSQLQESAIKNYSTLKLTVIDLENEGYVKTRDVFEGRKTIYVSLTEKGRAVAEKLKEAEEVAKMEPGEIEKYKNLHALQHFNMYEDHITITDISIQGVKYVNIYARPRGEILYFYCEDCGKDDCYHIGYLFFDSKLREFVKKWVEKNGYKLAPKYEKYVEKYW